MHQQYYDIAIVGGGINGLTIAVALANKNFNIILIEKYSITNKLKNFRDGRGISIASQSRKILEKYDAWSNIANEDFGEIHKIFIRDGDSINEIKFDNELINNQSLGFIIESDNIIKGLYEKILLFQNVTLIEEAECKDIQFIDEKSVIVLSSGDTIRSSVSIVAEGKNSSMRSILDVNHRVKSYNQTAIICNIKHSLKHNNCAYEHFLPRGPFALLPLKNPYQSSVVWSDSNKIGDLDINDSEAENFIKDRCIDTHGNATLISSVSKFPLSLSYMHHYFKGRAVFIGDSIHSIHPLAGQGYNLSLRDIDMLVSLFCEYRSLGLDIGSKTLFNKFTKKRKKDNFAMIAITDGLNSLFSNDNSLLKYSRRIGLSVINNAPIAKKFFMQYAMGRR